MMIFQQSQKVSIVSRALFIKIGIAVMVLWFIISLCAKGLTTATKPMPALIHDEGHLIVPEQSPLRHAITVQPVFKQAFAVPFTRPATVFADPARILNVQSPVVGQLVMINKKLGDYVKAGEALFAVRSPDIAQMIGELEKSQANLLFLKQYYERQKQLSVSNIASAQDVQQANNDYQQAISELERIRSQLTILHAKTTQHSDRALLTVRSPIAGFVTELNAATGVYWNNTVDCVLTIADTTSVYINATVQENDVGKIFINQPVTIQLEAYSTPLHLTVDYIQPILNADTRTIDVGIVYDNQKGLLKPNMFATAEFMPRTQQRIVLPLTAVIQRGFDSIVFVEVSKWVFEPRIVHTGQQLNDRIEIVSGLMPKERVAITGGIILND